MYLIINNVINYTFLITDGIDKFIINLIINYMLWYPEDSHSPLQKRDL